MRNKGKPAKRLGDRVSPRLKEIASAYQLPPSFWPWMMSALGVWSYGLKRILISTEGKAPSTVPGKSPQTLVCTKITQGVFRKMDLGDARL